MSSRNDILSRISKIADANPFNLPDEPEWDSEPLKLMTGSLVSAFTAELEKVSGICYEADSVNALKAKLESLSGETDFNPITCYDPEMAKQLGLPKSAEGDEPEALIVPCDYLISSTGSVLVSAALGGRKMFVYPPVLIVVAGKNQLVPMLGDGLAALKLKYAVLPSMISLITGPSRTADIEKTLVLGAHGPRKLIVFMLPEKALK